MQKFSVPNKDKTNKFCLGFIGSMSGEDSDVNLTMGQIIAGKFHQAGYPIVLASSKHNRSVRLLDMLVTILSRYKDIHVLIIQVYSGLSFVYVDICSWFGKLLGLPTIFHVHGGDIPSLIEKKPGWAQRVFKRADIVVVPSIYLAQSIKQIGFSPVVIPNIVDLSRYQYRRVDSATLKLVWLRAFHSIYNPTLAAKTLVELNKRGHEPFLIMVGPDKHDGSFSDFLQMVKAYGVMDQTNITGRIPNDQVPEVLSQGDIFINTTNVDNTPVSVIEAMACGLCIVSTNVGGIPYLLENGVDALLVPPDDPKAMAEAIIQIINDPSLAAKLSSNARKKAETFDWSIVVHQWENLFSDILTNE